VRLYVHEWGDPAGPPLVCLHGVTGHGRRFRRLAEERWGATRRVLAFDLRGHGRSGWEPPWTYPTHVADLVETAEELGLQTADWAGHSFGGRLVLELAAAHPRLVRRAILLDPAIQLPPHIAGDTADAELRQPVYPDREAFIAERLDPNPQTPRLYVEEDADEHLEPLPDGSFRRRACQPAVVSIYAEIASAPPPPETLQVPTLLLYAPDYGLVREEQIEAYRSALGDLLRVVPVPGMHMVMWDAFEETANAVEEFLEDGTN
jgi:lipase